MRAHVEAIAKLQAKVVADLVEHELVTKDFLKSELREEFRREINELKVQLHALQLGGAIAVFGLGAIVPLSRLIAYVDDFAPWSFEGRKRRGPGAVGHDR